MRSVPLVSVCQRKCSPAREDLSTTQAAGFLHSIRILFLGVVAVAGCIAEGPEDITGNAKDGDDTYECEISGATGSLYRYEITSPPIRKTRSVGTLGTRRWRQWTTEASSAVRWSRPDFDDGVATVVLTQFSNENLAAIAQCEFGTNTEACDQRPDSANGSWFLGGEETQDTRGTGQHSYGLNVYGGVQFYRSVSLGQDKISSGTGSTNAEHVIALGVKDMERYIYKFKIWHYSPSIGAASSESWHAVIGETNCVF